MSSAELQEYADFVVLNNQGARSNTGFNYGAQSPGSERVIWT